MDILNNMTEPTNTPPQQTSDKVEINLKSLLESGGHFGSRTSNWHPKASPFIYGSKKGIYIIDLEKTIRLWNKKVRPAIVEAAKNGKNILFVSTKNQGRQAFTESAIRSGSPYVNERWRAGLLTNFKVVRKSVETLEKYEEQIAKFDSGQKTNMTKQEANLMRKEIQKLGRDCNGLRNLKKLPDFIFVTDASKEELAIAEAKKLDIPVISLVDTNVDPTTIDYPLPANDDAVKTISLFSRAIADAIVEGKNERVVVSAAAEAELANTLGDSLSEEAKEAVELSKKVSEENRGISDKIRADTAIKVERISKKKPGGSKPSQRKG